MLSNVLTRIVKPFHKENLLYSTEEIFDSWYLPDGVKLFNFCLTSTRENFETLMKFIQITGHVRLFCTFYFSNKIVFTWRYLSFNEQVTFWTSINRVSVERVRSSLGVKVFVSAQQTPVEELQLSCEKNWCTWFSFAAQITFISWKTMISEICHYLWRYDVCGCAWISYDL